MRTMKKLLALLMCLCLLASCGAWAEENGDAGENGVEFEVEDKLSLEETAIQEENEAPYVEGELVISETPEEETQELGEISIGALGEDLIDPFIGEGSSENTGDASSNDIDTDEPAVESYSNGQTVLDFPIKIKNNHGNGASFDFSLEECVMATMSTDYNPNLADMLMALSAAAYNGTSGRSGELTLEKSGYNAKKSWDWNVQNRELCYISKAYQDLGFTDFEAFNYYNKPDAPEYGEDNIAFTIGAKDVFEDESIVLIVFRGSYGAMFEGASDWNSNFKISTNKKGRHTGFSNALEKAYKQINSFLNKRYKTDYIKSNIRYVVTGHSRGAAIANLLEVKLREKGIRKYRIYGYNFASPDVARIPSITNWTEGYENIFNICNTADFVSVIPGVIGNIGKKLISKEVLDLFLSWGKYGNTYFYCNDWNSVKEFDLLRTMDEESSPHDYKYYVRDMGKKGTEFYSWIQVVARRIDLIAKENYEKLIKAIYPNAVAQDVEKIPMKVLSKTGDNETIKIKAGNEIQLIPKFALVKGWLVKSWSSNNQEVATVSKKGVVEALKGGDAVITVATKNGKKAEVTIKVSPINPTKVEITKGEKATLRVGGKLTLKTKLTPAKAATTLTWKSSDTKVATVSSKGVVTAKKVGKATITVKTKNGKKDAITITVKPKRVELAGYMMNKDIKSFAKKFGLKLKIDEIEYSEYPAWGYGSFYYRILSCKNSQIRVSATATSERKSDLKKVETGVIDNLTVKGSDFKLLGVYVGMSADSAMDAARKYLNKKFPYDEWDIAIDYYDGRDFISISSYGQPFMGDFTLKNGKVSEMGWGYVWFW